MICYKFNYINETAVQTIAVPTSSEIILGIGNGQDTVATITLIDDDTGEAAGTVIPDPSGIIPYYKLFKIVTPTEVSVKTYTATVSGTIDEEAYSHTIKVKVIANTLSNGTIA